MFQNKKEQRDKFFEDLQNLLERVEELEPGDMIINIMTPQAIALKEYFKVKERIDDFIFVPGQGDLMDVKRVK